MSVWLAAALSAAFLVQQPAPADSEPTTVDSLIVTAKPAPDKEAVKGFINAIAGETGNGRLGRWDRTICPGVVGLRRDYAQAMIEHISDAAADVGLKVGESGCRANLVIFATSDSDAFVGEMIHRFPDVFAKYDSQITAGRKALKAFAVSPEPVRWWHVTRRVTADGVIYEEGAQVRVRGASRIRSNTRDDFDHVIIVLDTSRIGKVRFGALADYVAMAGLAQLDPGADTGGANTILNLFSDREAGATPPEGLTDWDRAYLDGLYAARRDVRRAKSQKDEMSRTMTDDLGGTGKPKE